MQKESSGSNYERHIGIMGTVKLKRLNELEEELKKTQEEIDNINHEEETQDKLYNLEYNSKVKKLKDIQSVIDIINIETLENAIPKYFKAKGTLDSVEVFRTNKMFPDRGTFKLLANALFYYRNTKTNQSDAIFRANKVIILGSNLNEAVNHISSYYEEITEEEYNEVGKMVREFILKSMTEAKR